jgi:uncharacterized membrane protein YfcA
VRLLRFRLRTLMLLVLLAALGTAAGLHLSRLDPEDFIEQFAILGPFLVLVVLKMGLVIEFRLRRARRNEPNERTLEDRPSSPSSSGFRTGR